MIWTDEEAREASRRHVADLPDLPRDIRAAFGRALLTLEAERDALDQYKQRTDALCPEDVGIAEFVGALLTQRNRAESRLSEAVRALREAGEVLFAASLAVPACSGVHPDGKPCINHRVTGARYRVAEVLATLERAIDPADVGKEGM